MGIINTNYLGIEFDQYSFSRTKTKSIWIDGKEIYRRCFEFINENQTYQKVGNTGDDFETITRIDGILRILNGSYVSVNGGRSSTKHQSITIIENPQTVVGIPLVKGDILSCNENYGLTLGERVLVTVEFTII